MSTVTEINPTEDFGVWPGYPTKYSPTDIYLKIGSRYSGQMRAMVLFDIPSEILGANIIKVEFGFAYYLNTADFNSTVELVTALDTASLGTSPTVGAFNKNTREYEWFDFTSVFDPDAFEGFMFRSIASNVGADAYSMEHSNTSLRPKMRIEWEPPAQVMYRGWGLPL